MEEIRVFLLDLNVESRHGCTLRGILRFCKTPPVNLREKSIKGHETAFSNNAIVSAVSHFNPHVIFIVLPSNFLEHVSSLIRALTESRELLVIAMMEADEPEDMGHLLDLGVVDFITPPPRKIDVLPRLWRSLQRKTHDELLLQKCKEKVGLKQMIGNDPAFLAEVNKIPLIAGCDASVLILGETGTGKDLCARAIHYLSPRSGKPVIPVSCGAIPTDLVENELFGHETGAFTGASKSHPGMIHEAKGGTLFLDEIDCLPLQAQSKLLRFLQDKEYRRLGSTELCHADVRVIAASNIDLAKSVSEGTFRQDLYFRLNVIPLTLPALRDRKADIPLLAQYFLNRYTTEFDKPSKTLSANALQKLVMYRWPGNVRELENIIQRAVVFSQREVIQSAEVSLSYKKDQETHSSFKAQKSRVIAQFEKNYIQDILLTHQGNISKAAKAARKHRRAFWELIRKHEIDVHNYRN